ncbi:MAG: FHA domain-containing protein [Gammaproteobacteria bacterium]|nr:FHA domain-containing protein [Gammaproteobacteria bacterium]
MARLILQVGHKGHRGRDVGVNVFKSTGSTVLVGRAFSNDVVLSDPYVSAEQLRFVAQDGKWFVEPVEVFNPVTVDGETLDDRRVVHPGSTVTIGRTSIGIFDESHPVEPPKAIPFAGWLHKERPGLVVAGMAWAATASIEAILGFFTLAADGEWGEYIVAGLLSAAFMLVWAGLWAIVGRLLRHQPHFASQLFVTAVVVAIGTVALPILDYVDFILGHPDTSDWFGFGLAFVFGAILLKFNLLFATNIHRSTLAAVCVSAAVIGLIAAVSQMSRHDSGAVSPQYSELLRPPIGLSLDGEDLESYLASVQANMTRTLARRADDANGE